MEFAYWVNPLLAGTQRNTDIHLPELRDHSSAEEVARRWHVSGGSIDFVSIQPVFFFQLSRKVFFRQVLKVFIGQGVQFIFEATG